MSYDAIVSVNGDDLSGDNAGQVSRLPEISERRKGFSVASRSDRLCSGDLPMKVATGKLGKGFSIGDSIGFLIGSGR